LPIYRGRVSGLLDPTHLINAFGLLGIMAILFAE
jgi:hypothetical protein